MKIDCDPLIRAINRYIEKADKDMGDELKVEGFVSIDQAIKSIGEIEDGVTEALQTHADDVLERLQAATGLPNFISEIWPTIKDADDLEKALHDIFKDQFDTLMHQTTIDWIISQDPELPVEDTRITKPAQEFVKSWSSDLAKLMKLKTNEQIEKVLLRADEEKRTIDQVAEDIANSGIRNCGYRARTVAVTEVLRMESYGQQEAMVQNPSAYKKSWVHCSSDHPRQNHIAMDGITVFKRETFTLIGKDGSEYHPICPRDTCLPASESVNCHCIMKVIEDANVLGMTPEERAELRTKYMDEIDAEFDAKEQEAS